MFFNDDVKFIDEHFDIQFSNIIDRIYNMSDGPVCYTCKIIGHISRYCGVNLDD